MAQVFTDADFKTEVLSSEIPVLVDFWAEWCGPCVMMGPILEDLNEDLSDKIKIGKINIDDNQEITQKFNISSIPTFILFKNNELIEQVTGSMTQDELSKIIQKHL